MDGSVVTFSPDGWTSSDPEKAAWLNAMSHLTSSEPVAPPLVPTGELPSFYPCFAGYPARRGIVGYDGRYYRRSLRKGPNIGWEILLRDFCLLEHAQPIFWQLRPVVLTESAASLLRPGIPAPQLTFGSNARRSV
jgi:hypothetical protein